MIIPVGWALWVQSYYVVGDSEEMICTMGVKVSTWGGDYTTGVDWLTEKWNDCIDASLSNQATHGPDRIIVGQDGGDPLTFEGSIGGVGGSPEFPIWPNSALLVKKQTASGGRRNRGRMYLPAFGLRDLIGQAGEVDLAYLEDFQTNLDAFTAAVDAGTDFEPTDLGVLHSQAPSTPAVITRLVADPKLATQRRRLRP